MPVETESEVTILISSVEEETLQWLRQQLQGYRVIEAHSGAEALEATTKLGIDILMTGSQLPDMTGLELCTRINQLNSPLRPSVVVLSPSTNLDALQAAYDAGASGVIPPHPSGMELHNAIQMALKVRTIEEQISHLFREFQRLADTDPLTQMPNRRLLEDAGAREVSRAQRTNEPLAVLMLDIDWFKEINDQHGHEVGDDVLIAFSKLMRSHLRNHDIIVRYGGDEFVAILPNTAPSQAFVVAEKLRALVEESIFQTKQGPMRFTISIGIAMWQLSHTSIDSTIRQADVALYQSKEAGRNRTVLLHNEQT